MLCILAMFCMYKQACHACVLSSHSRHAEWDPLHVPRGLSSERQLMHIWFSHRTGPLRHSQRTTSEALSLPPADPTYSVQDILWTPPYRTALPRSYKIRVTCLKAMNGKRQSPGPPQFHCAGLTAHDSRQTAIVISEVYSSWRMQSPPYW